MPPIPAIAEKLRAARDALRQIPPLSQTDGLAAVGDAYAVQLGTIALWQAAGRRVVGRKIGLTSKAVQAQLGVDQPDAGVLWADYAFTAGEAVDTRRFMQPKAELELAFVLDRACPEPDLTMAELIRRVAYAVPALEIVDSVIADWKITLADTVADNASGGGFLLGLDARRVTDLDLRLAGAILSRDGAPVSTGVGVNCLGHPLNALLWLTRAMAAQGRPIGEGEIVMSGALGPMVPVASGEVYTAEIAGFAPLQVAFSDGRAGA